MQASLEDDSATCSGRQTWVCSVPLDTLESGFVEVTFSVDEAVWHSYSTPFIFQFVPEVACDLDGPPQLPDGCTFDMLRDPACNPECNVRHCAHDNRACPTSAVVVDAQFGDDGSNGTDVHPVRSLGRAVRLACTGFSVCLPVHVQPGNAVPASARNVNKKGLEQRAQWKHWDFRGTRAAKIDLNERRVIRALCQSLHPLLASKGPLCAHRAIIYHCYLF